MTQRYGLGAKCPAQVTPVYGSLFCINATMQSSTLFDVARSSATGLCNTELTIFLYGKVSNTSLNSRCTHVCNNIEHKPEEGERGERERERTVLPSWREKTANFHFNFYYSSSVML